MFIQYRILESKNLLLNSSMNMQVMIRMNKQVKAEILKVVRSNQLIIWISIIVLFCLLMFIQKGINVNSGFYTPELITAQYMSSFNLLIFALLGFIPGAFIGAYLAGIEYSSNTNSSLILSSGRSRTIFHKIIGLLIIIFIMTISISMLGFLEGLAFNYKSIYSLNISSIVKQMFSSFLIVSRVSVIAFLGATLTKRFY